MKISQKKLEELIYLSLIAEYDYMQLNGNETLIGFKGSRPLCIDMTKPICITSNKLGSDSMTRQRVIRFEEKIFAKSTFIERLKGETKFILSKRIKLLVEHCKKNEVIYSLYKNNINTLKICGVIDEIQRLGAIHYVEDLRNKTLDANYESFK